MNRIGICALAVAAIWVVASQKGPAAASVPASQPAQGSAERLMLEIAKTYPNWGRVDDENRWAPFLCRSPIAGWDRFSDSDDESTHGKKIYALYAKDRDAYVSLNDNLPKDVLKRQALNGEKITACDQVIVKESFTPEELNAGKPRPFGQTIPAVRDGKQYVAGEKRDLFIMAHLRDRSAMPKDSLDEGWMYATVSPDGKSVTSVGRIASCMKCHAEAPHGRLFGVAK